LLRNVNCEKIIGEKPHPLFALFSHFKFQKTKIITEIGKKNNMTSTPKEWIKHLNLTVHPEGGYFSENYRNNNLISDVELTQKYTGKRNLSTSIYFLLEQGQVSKLHRLKSDEIWYFHHGAPIHVHVFDKGQYSLFTMGTSFHLGQLLQLVIPAGTVFGAQVTSNGAFSILGCMVSPGFHFDDFELVPFEEMMVSYPNNGELIQKLT
jgi:hypothetical protein